MIPSLHIYCIAFKCFFRVTSLPSYEYDQPCLLLHHDDKLTPNMMSEHDNDGEFASVVWDTPDAANKSANAGGHGDNGGEQPPSSSTGGTTGGAGAGTTSNADHQDYTQSTSSSAHMMHRAGSTASHHTTTTTGASAGHASGAAAAAGDASGSGRYWIKASVIEPVKMLEGTKDAYVAYNVKGEVRFCIAVLFYRDRWAIYLYDQSPLTLPRSNLNQSCNLLSLCT